MLIAKTIVCHEPNVKCNTKARGLRRGGELHLDSHDLVAGLVDHLVDRAVRPPADLPQVLEVLGREVTVLLRGDLQLP